MEVVYRDTQIEQIANKLGITKTSVESVWLEYVDRLKSKIAEGKTIKFLNICYLRVNGDEDKTHETLAYISTEIGNKLSISGTVVYRILTTFEELLIKDLQRFYSYSIRGLIRIRLEKNSKGDYKVRIKKSTVYNGYDVYVLTLGSFKRKVEM